MNEHDLDDALRSIHVERRQLPDAPTVRHQLLAVPLHQTPQQRGWLPRLFQGTKRSLFTATKFAAVATVFVLFGGFLLMSVLTQPPSDGAPAGGSASPEASSSVEATRGPDQADKENDVKKLRTPVATALAIGLLATPVAPVVAQADLMEPAAVTGTSGPQEELSGGSRMWDGSKVRGDGASAAYSWDASDPRLTGTFISNYSYDFYEGLELFLAAGDAALETDQGRWVGESSFVGGDALRGTVTIIMQGEGAYDGLTAYVVVDDDARPRTFNAAIFPGEMPTTTRSE